MSKLFIQFERGFPRNESWESTHHVHVCYRTITGKCFSKQVKKRNVCQCPNIQGPNCWTLVVFLKLKKRLVFSRRHCCHIVSNELMLCLEELSVSSAADNKIGTARLLW